MDALKTMFLEIRGILDTEGVHNLLLDCFEIAQQRGEAEGVAHARMLLKCVKEYQQGHGSVPPEPET